MAYGWEGEKVRLAPLNVERHLDNAVSWLNDPEVTQYLLVGDMPITRLGEKEYFSAADKTSQTNVAWAIETLDGVHIGFSGVHQINWQHRSATTGTIIGDKTYWRHGFGSDAAQIRSRYCFDVLGLRLLLSGCIAENVGSHRMLTGVGYVEYGRLAERFWKRGAFREEILLCLSRDHWLETQEKPSTRR
jgi:RimJ/RimL family protein N-acetyltransferase